MFFQHLRGDFRVHLDQLEDRILGNFRSSGRKVHQGFKARVWLAEHCVSVTGHDLTRLQGTPKVIFDVLFGEGGTDVRLHL